jgi:phosphomannomutase
MDDRHLWLLDALAAVRLLPRRAEEHEVIYGYVARESLPAAAATIAAALESRGCEVRRIAARDDTVILARHCDDAPLAIRLTASSRARYDLYALSRPATAQALWQWAQVMARHQQRRDRSR